MSEGAEQEFQRRLRAAVSEGALVRLTLGAYHGTDPTVRQLTVRPVTIKAGPRLAFVWRHAARDVTKNFTAEEALAQLAGLVGGDFSNAHLHTAVATVQLEVRAGRPPRLHVGPPSGPVKLPAQAHDRTKARTVSADSRWLQALGVTTAEGKVCKGMEAKFRQIHRFVELLGPLLVDVPRPTERPLTLVDMGCGKGYLTFAAHAHLTQAAGVPVRVLGIEARPELAELCERVARETGADGLSFLAGSIADSPVETADVLLALHACDTATDDALAKGVAAEAALLVVAPCCHREVRPQLVPPAALAEPFRHGILRERQAEFVTDALRAALLEWAGYVTSVIEFISPEHTGKNLMITAVRHPAPARQAAAARRVRELAAFYGVRQQALAARLGFDLAPAADP